MTPKELKAIQERIKFDGPATALCRFIPAHAGNSTLRIIRRREHTVHPRACGEQADERTAETGVRGSSPRMRGTECISPWKKGSEWFKSSLEHATNVIRQVLTMNAMSCIEEDV